MGRSPPILGQPPRAVLPILRGGNLTGYAAVARSFGLDPHAMLRQAGLPPRALDEPDMPLSAKAVNDLLDASAAASGADDFALRMIAQRRLSTLGPISIVLQEAATPREALGILLRYQSLISPFLLMRTEEHEGLTIIHIEILYDLPGPIPHGYASTLAIVYRALSDLLGVSWRPSQVSFRHRPPVDTRGFRAFFRCPVEFDAEFNGLVCHSADLETPIAGADPGRASFVRRQLEEALIGQDLSTTAVVRRVITALITTGRATTDQVARLLGLDRRTIHRRLALEEQTFSTVLQSVRYQLALDQVMGSNRSVGEIASLLGFTAPNAFSTWFKGTFGTSVTEMRRRG